MSFEGLAASFLMGTEDVPLMQNFQVSEDETFSMESPEENGRLFFSKAFTQSSPEDVLRFYHQTLPELGWKENQQGDFEREGDVLKIGVETGAYEKHNLTTVIFELITK